MSEPFTWVFTDVNGQALEIAGDPVHRSPQDLRVYTPLYTHHARAVVPDAMILDDEPNPESLESIAYVSGWNDCREKVLEYTPDKADEQASVADKRPSNCREKARQDGGSYPKSGCFSCGKSWLFIGCPHSHKQEPAQ